MDWTEEKVLRLIYDIKFKPWLWDWRHKENKNTAKKRDTYAELGERFDCDGTEIERKWAIIRGQHRRQMKKTRRAGKHSKWFAFPALSYLENQYGIKVKKSVDASNAPLQILDVTLLHSPVELNKTELQSDESEVGGDKTFEDIQVYQEKHQTPPAKRLRKSRKKVIKDVIVSPTVQIQKPEHSTLSPPTAEVCSEVVGRIDAGVGARVDAAGRDEYDIYVENIAVKLRKIPSERMRIQVQRDMDNLIYDALTLTGSYKNFKY